MQNIQFSVKYAGIEDCLARIKPEIRVTIRGQMAASGGYATLLGISI